MTLKFKNGDEFEYDSVLIKLECVWLVLKSRMVFLVNKLNLEDDSPDKAQQRSSISSEQ